MTKALLIKIISAVLSVGVLGGAAAYFIVSNRTTGRNAAVYLIEADDDNIVSVTRDSEELEAYEGMRLEKGDIVSTQERSAVYITMDDDKTFKLNVKSSLLISSANSKKIELELKSGEMYYNIENKLKDDEECVFQAGGRTMSVRGTSGLITLVTDGVLLQQYSGSVEVSDNNGNTTLLQSGDKLSSSDGENKPFTTTPLTVDDITFFSGLEIAGSDTDLDDDLVGSVTGMVEIYKDLNFSNVTLYIGVKCTVPEHDGLVSLSHFTPQPCGKHFMCEDGDHQLLGCGHYACEHGEHKKLECGHYACLGGEHKKLECGHYACEEGTHQKLECGKFTCDGHDHSKCTKPDPCANGHKPGDEATCLTAQACTVCGTVLTQAKGHSFGEATITAATCSVAGRKERVCSACGTSEIETIPKAEHKPEWTVTKAATCAEVGIESNICLACQEVIDTREIPVTDEHKYESVVTAATCTDDGFTTYTCSVCKHNYTDDTVAAFGHSFEWVSDVAATCGSAGIKHEKCIRCNETRSINTIVAATDAHTYIPGAVVDATCTVDGYTVYSCSYCNSTYRGNTVTALGHNFTWITDTAPTCGEQGSKHEDCTRCDVTQSLETVIPATGEHTYETTETAATCTEEGYTTYTCSVCEHSYTGDTVAALGHDFEWIVDADPTCGAEGSKHEDCTRCDVTQSLETVIPATGEHTYETAETAATCTEDGYTTYTCSVCEHSYTGDTVAALGHDFVWIIDAPETCGMGGLKHEDCTRCDVTQSLETVIPATGEHKYETTETAATCTEEGYTTYTCSVCEHSYTGNTVAALGHDFEWIIDAPETCGTGGLKHEDCTRCDVTQSLDTVIPATGEHKYETAETAATCTEEGYTTYTCSVCEHSYTGDKVAALGHDFEWIIDAAPTCGAEGSKHEDCTRCDVTQSLETVIPATGEHTYETTEISATCTEDGYTTYTCSVCEHSYTGDTVAALGHDFEWIIDAPATCGTVGLKHEDCTRCDVTQSPNTVIPATGVHSYEYTQKEATCTEGGSKGYICSVCSAKKDFEESEPLGHQYAYTYLNETSHTAVCNRAGCTFSETQNHTDPGCGTAGHCTICGDTSIDHSQLACGEFACSDHATITSTHGEVLCGSGTDSDPYLIDNYVDYCNFANAHNNEAVLPMSNSESKAVFSDINKSFLLTADIDFAGKDFPSINEFSGSFDGCEYQFKNVTCAAPMFTSLIGDVANLSIAVNANVEDGEFFGVFAGTNSGTIDNCILSGSVTGVTYVAGIAGHNLGAVTRCMNYATISGVNGVGGITAFNGFVPQYANMLGLIVGAAQAVQGIGEGLTPTATVSECVNNATVEACAYVGGIVGDNNALISDSENNGAVTVIMSCGGGVVGWNGNIANVSNCTNSADTTGTALSDSRMPSFSTGNYVGGISGMNFGIQYNCDNSASVIAATSSNVGGISGSSCGIIDGCDNTSTTESIHGKDHVGGVVGYCYYPSGGLVALETKNCTNSASIVAQSDVGGIVGEHYSGSITYCTNNATVTVSDSAEYGSNYGGIVGEDIGGTINNCTNNGDITGLSFTGGILGKGKSLSNCVNTANVSGVNRVGGIIGYCEDGTIVSCNNTSATAVVEGTQYVGGIAGDVFECDISNCDNASTIYSSETDSAYFGGIVGSMLGGILSSSDNTGSVSSYMNVGGIVGCVYNEGIVEMCNNYGAVSGEASIGGIAGENFATLNQCHNDSPNITGNTDVSGIAGYNDKNSTCTDCTTVEILG